MTLSSWIKANVFHSTTALYQLSLQNTLLQEYEKSEKQLCFISNLIAVKQANAYADLIVAGSQKKIHQLSCHINKYQHLLDNLTFLRNADATLERFNQLNADSTDSETNYFSLQPSPPPKNHANNDLS